MQNVVFIFDIFFVFRFVINEAKRLPKVHVSIIIKTKTEWLAFSLQTLRHLAQSLGGYLF